MFVYRQSAIRQLQNLMIFGDNPSGEIFYVDADKLPKGGQDGDPADPASTTRARAKTLLQLIQREERRAGQAAGDARRPALRRGPQDGQIFVLNKRDGVIRLFVPDGK